MEAAQWSATPAVAAQSEQWLGAAVTVLTPEQRALAVVDCAWNLRQFELAQRTRGMRTLRNVYRGFMRRNWRPVRWGLAGLVAVQLLGMNVLAWQQNHQLQQRRDALNATLTSTFPQVRAVLNAPVQMQREAEALRASAGRAGPQDFETPARRRRQHLAGRSRPGRHAELRNRPADAVRPGLERRADPAPAQPVAQRRAGRWTARKAR